MGIKKKILLVLILAAAIIFIIFRIGKFDRTQEVKEYTAFFAITGPDENKDSRLRRKIAGIVGAEAYAEKLSGQTAEEKIASFIAAGEYPDFIDGSNATDMLIEAGALIPLEDKIKDYPNLRKYLTEEQWESLKKEDGHIYFIPPYGVVNGKSTATMPSGEAFWIQKRVLKWAGYPKVKTLDQYFDLIEDYRDANPVTNGGETIGFEILCDDWRYFCLENPPMFLAGYPNNGCAIVDEKTGKCGIYDTLPEAEQYYRKLNEIYNKGLIDRETFTLSYDQYLQKLSSGRVLGMVDQYWEIIDAESSLKSNGMDEYSYIPLPIVANEDIEGNYLCRENKLNTASGIGISVSCRDVDGALSFLDGLLSEEVMLLRNWGEEGIDYEVDSDGRFYRTEEQTANWKNGEFLEKNKCPYSQFPGYEGMLPDNINTVKPGEQPEIFYASLSEADREIMDAYSHKTWKEFLGEEKDGAEWFPLYSVTSDWDSFTDYGRAKLEMERIKRKWLPQVIMAEKGHFDEKWKEYMTEYDYNVDKEAYIKRLDYEVEKRMK
ncbi:MAG: extracellular solute-binding protein [Lachnospiraceae bacterium]|nr:extracellular solute-binding protein [Lachnospiraceae bacterium]